VFGILFADLSELAFILIVGLTFNNVFEPTMACVTGMLIVDNNVFVKGQASTSRKMLRNKVGKQTMERIEMVEAGYEHYKRYYPNGEGIDPNNRYYKIGQRVAEILNPTTHPNY
jgi:hypothetical protein